jgi:Protein of unknown function (DUF2769)
MDIDEAEQICICKTCPSFVDCGERFVFCLREVGKSQCIEKEIACLCTACPVQELLGYQHEYYCTRGSEEELSGQ